MLDNSLRYAIIKHRIVIIEEIQKTQEIVFKVRWTYNAIHYEKNTMGKKVV